MKPKVNYATRFGENHRSWANSRWNEMTVDHESLFRETDRMIYLIYCAHTMTEHVGIELCDIKP